MRAKTLSEKLTILSDPQRPSTILNDHKRSSAILSDPQRSSAILSDPQRSSAILSDPQRSSAILSDPQRSPAIIWKPGLKAGLHMQLFMCDFMQLITSTKISRRVAYVNACATCCNFHTATYCDLVQPATYLGLRSYFATKLQ